MLIGLGLNGAYAREDGGRSVGAFLGTLLLPVAVTAPVGLMIGSAVPKARRFDRAGERRFSSPHVAWPDSLAIRPTYWKEGAVIGGAVLGVGTFVLGYLVCQDLSDTGGCLGYAAGVGALMTFGGAIIGALIGGGIEKKEKPQAAPGSSGEIPDR